MQPGTMPKSGVRQPPQIDKIRNTASPDQAIIEDAETLRARLQRIEADAPLPRIEDRCTDEDWIVAALALGHHLFWLDEATAWRWLAPRFVEALAYSHPLRDGLIAAAAEWEAHLSNGGRKRLEIFRGAAEAITPALVDELEKLAQAKWLAGEDEEERAAILDWVRGQMFAAQSQQQEALAVYERAEARLGLEQQTLLALLASARSDLAWQMIHRTSATVATDPASPLHVWSSEAERLLRHVVERTPQEARAWTRLGMALALSNKHGEAVTAFQRACQLAPQDPLPHCGLGGALAALGRHEEAIAAYRRALELNPENLAAHQAIGDIEQQLGHYDAAINAYQCALQIDSHATHALASLAACYHHVGREQEALGQLATARAQLDADAFYQRACLEAACGNINEALEFLQREVRRNAAAADWARQHHEFDAVRDDPRFHILLGDIDTRR